MKVAIYAYSIWSLEAIDGLEEPILRALFSLKKQGKPVQYARTHTGSEENIREVTEASFVRHHGRRGTVSLPVGGLRQVDLLKLQQVARLCGQEIRGA